jgi:hypothetical protein
MRRALSLGLLHLALTASAAIPALLLAAPARADTVDAAARSTARKLGVEAVKLFETGDYAGALDKFNTADSLVPAPTLGLYAARCLVKMGRLVEASERYLEVTRMQLDRTAVPVMRKAQVDAVAERERLQPTIPTLEVRVEGPRGNGLEVAVGGKVLVPGLLGEKRAVNPGTYQVTATRPDTAVTEEVRVSPGGAARVVLKLPPLPPEPEARMPVLRRLGWAGIGLAGAGLVTGGVAGLVALAKGQALLVKCTNHVCTTPANLALTGPYDAARAASTAGFVAAAVGAAIGVPILVVSPRVEYAYPDGRTAPPPRSAPPRAAIETWLTWGGAGLRGIF